MRILKVISMAVAVGGICAVATALTAQYFEDRAFRLEVRRQFDDKTLEIGSNVEKALWRFALEKTDARNPFDLEYSIDRVPVTGQRGVYIYTVRFMDREVLRPLEIAEAKP